MEVTRHVVHILGTLKHGGAEHRLLDLANAEMGTDHILHTILLLGDSEGELAAQFRDAGWNVLLVGKRPVSLWKTFRSLKPDVAHSHVLFGSGWVLLLARLSGISHLIAHIRSTGSGTSSEFRRLIYEPVMRYLIERLATTIAAVSESALYGALGPEITDRAKGDVEVLYNGYPMSRSARPMAQRRHQDRLSMVIVGRVSGEKNQRHAIEVLAELSKQADVALRIVGRSTHENYKEELSRQIHSLGVERSVAFLDEQPMESALAGADVLLAPSLREGLPGVVIEAIASGVPVVASDIAPMTEVARLLEGVAVVPLADFAGWCEAVLAAQQHDSERLTASFAASPFRLESSIAAHQVLWRGFE